MAAHGSSSSAFDDDALIFKDEADDDALMFEDVDDVDLGAGAAIDPHKSSSSSLTTLTALRFHTCN